MSETKIEIWGRLGKEPIHRKSIKPNMMFPLAYKVGGQNLPTWYDVYSEIKIPEIQAYLRKGMWCKIIGTLIEVRKGKKTIRQIIIEENDTDIIEFRRDVPQLRNNYE